MVALFVAGLETPTRRLISAVMLIAFGTATASYGELSFSLIGVVVMFLSECFESARLVMTQILLVGLKFHPSVSLTPPLPFLCDVCHSRLTGDLGYGLPVIQFDCTEGWTAVQLSMYCGSVSRQGFALCQSEMARISHGLGRDEWRRTKQQCSLIVYD